MRGAARGFYTGPATRRTWPSTTVGPASVVAVVVDGLPQPERPQQRDHPEHEGQQRNRVLNHAAAILPEFRREDVEPAEPSEPRYSSRSRRHGRHGGFVVRRQRQGRPLPTRRAVTQALGLLATSPLWDVALAEAEAQRTVSADTVRALLEAQGEPGIFADPARFEELRSAVARTAAHVAALSAFPVSDDVPPAIGFRRP